MIQKHKQFSREGKREASRGMGHFKIGRFDFNKFCCLCTCSFFKDVEKCT